MRKKTKRRKEKKKRWKWEKSRVSLDGEWIQFCRQHSKKKIECWKGANCHFKIEMNHSDKCRQSGNDGMGGWRGERERKELLIEFNASCAIWPKLLRKFTSLTAIIISPCIYFSCLFQSYKCETVNFALLQLIVIMIWWWCWWWWW